MAEGGLNRSSGDMWSHKGIAREAMRQATLQRQRAELERFKELGPYARLDLDEEASPTEIKTAYRTKCLHWHPDRNDNPYATDYLAYINEAHDFLSGKDAENEAKERKIRHTSYSWQ